jgi:hypothetical protein
VAVVKPLIQYPEGLEEVRTGDTLAGVPPGGPAGGGNACTCTVDFGTGDHDASVVVTGQTWVTASSIIVATAQGEDARVEQITCNAGDLVDGEGFTVYAHAPYGAIGQFTVNCIGV